MPASSSIAMPEKAAEPEAVSMGLSDGEFERAFSEELKRVRSFVIRMGIRGADAEDVVAETFVVAHQRRHTFRSDCAVRPWLLGIAANLMRAHRRRRFMHACLEKALLREPPVHAGSGNVEEALIQAEDIRRVQKTLAKLPEKKRMLLVLREYEDLSAEEIAQVLGVPTATVYSKLHYARKDFLRCYRQQSLLEAPR